MRLEKITAKALEKYDFDRYLLAKAVGLRAQQLTEGAESTIDMKIEDHKASDIALIEIAEGKIEISVER